MPAQAQYSISSDFGPQGVNLALLDAEVKDAAVFASGEFLGITQGVDTNGNSDADAICIWSSNTANASQQAILDTIVANHPSSLTIVETPPVPNNNAPVILEDVNGSPGLPPVDGSQLLNLFAALYGTDDFEYSERTSIQKTTSTRPVGYHGFKKSLETGGDFIIFWFYVWSTNSTSRDIYVEVLVNDTIKLIDPAGLGYHRQEAKDKYNQRYTNCGFSKVTLSSGDNSVAMNFNSESSSSQACLHHARFMMWRISNA